MIWDVLQVTPASIAALVLLADFLPVADLAAAVHEAVAVAPSAVAAAHAEEAVAEDDKSFVSFKERTRDRYYEMI